MYPQVNDTLIQQFYGLDVDPTALVSSKQSTADCYWQISILKFLVVYNLLNFRIYGR